MGKAAPAYRSAAAQPVCAARILPVRIARRGNGVPRLRARTIAA